MATQINEGCMDFQYLLGVIREKMFGDHDSVDFKCFPIVSLFVVGKSHL